MELLHKGVAVALVTIGRLPSAVQREWLKRTAAEWPGAFRWEASEAPLEWMSNNERAYIDAEPLLLRVAREFGAQLLHSNQFCFGALPFPSVVAAHSDVLSWAVACRVQMESSRVAGCVFSLGFAWAAERRCSCGTYTVDARRSCRELFAACAGSGYCQRPSSKVFRAVLRTQTPGDNSGPALG